MYIYYIYINVIYVCCLSVPLSFCFMLVNIYIVAVFESSQQDLFSVAYGLLVSFCR